MISDTYAGHYVCVVTDQPETKKVATNDGKLPDDVAVVTVVVPLKVMLHVIGIN